MKGAMLMAKLATTSALTIAKPVLMTPCPVGPRPVLAPTVAVEASRQPHPRPLPSKGQKKATETPSPARLRAWPGKEILD